jgi:hypothetical protein
MMKNSYKRFFAPALFLAAAFFLESAGVYADRAAPIKDNPPPIRVLIAENQKLFRVNVKGAYTLRALPSLKVLKQGAQLSEASLTVSPRGFYFGKEEFLADSKRKQVPAALCWKKKSWRS